tara:strand:+ start:3996 stop:4652 length:657 start_codon:yes stop_codon:yes gene_type:complete
MLSLSAENHLKTIFHLSAGDLKSVTTNSIADALNTKAPSVSDMLKKLSEKDLISYTKYQGSSLTDSGRKLALNIIRKHRLWEVFLVEKLGFSWSEVHDVAEQLEHVKSKKLIKELDKFLNYPTKDPHGDPIPNPAGFIKYGNNFLLSDLKIGEKGKLVGVKDSSSLFLQFLDKRKIALGCVIEILYIEDFDNSVHIGLEDTNLSISLKSASNIYVNKI